MTEPPPFAVSSSPPVEPAVSKSRFREILDSFRRWSPQDWLVFAYLLYLNLALLPKYAQPDYPASAWRMFALLAVYLFILVPTRAGFLHDGFWGPLGYRVALQGTVQTSYFFFAAYLPLLNPKSLDMALFAFDMRWFGFEACVELDRFINPFTAEWFAFFYFCYFIVLTVHTLPILFFVRHQRLLGEFSFGLIFVFCIGHFFYTIVPGFGPYRAIPELLPHPLPHGLWVDTVLETVKNGGAQKDIFPSLHTAAPTFIALFSLRNRAYFPFRKTWQVMLFFAINIVIATMFMRWHWLIDVVAGLFLSFIAFGLSIVVTRFDLARRNRMGIGPSWPEFTRVAGFTRFASR
jgi:hypothetical protein